MSGFFSFTRLIQVFERYHKFFFDGLKTTLYISFFAVLMGTLLGLLFAFGKMSRLKVIKGICSLYIDIVRATPLLVQVMIIYYGTLSLGWKLQPTELNAFFWGMIAVGMNSGAYMSEVIRGGIGAVDAGQMEAARSIGMSKGKAMRYVVLPQAVRNILPAVANEFVTVIKETSVLGMCGIHEIMFRSGDVASIGYVYVETYVIAACMYFILVFPVSKLVAMLERRMNKSVTR